jgi:16S rRNA (guanine1207-N2)-methyltransferase
MNEAKPKTKHYFSPNPDSKAKYGLIQTHLRGKRFEFMTASSVFSKKRIDTGTRVLIETMQLPEKGTVLDVGCGYGAVGIAAARFNPALQVIMTDVNTRAVRLAQENIKRNKITNAEVRLGHLYEPVVGLEFNVILSNPPVSAGLDIVEALISEAPKVLTPKGSLQVVLRSKISGRLPSVFQSVFGNCWVLARESGYRVLMSERE